VNAEQCAGEVTRCVSTVMIVDDSPLVRKILEVSLRRSGIDQAGFSSGRAALRAIGSPPAWIPGMVVLDLHLPDMSGFALARLLRANPIFDQTAILLLTGYDSIFNRWRARLAGVDCFLTKPFKITEVISAIRRYLRVQSSAERAHNRGGTYASPIDAAIPGR
jgi:twitching motility two-component system response regulator PilG